MSVRNTVVFTTFANEVPAASRMALRFCSTRRVCAGTSPSISLLTAGSIGVCPAQNTRPFTRIACEYGPIALGASSVLMTVRFVALGAAAVFLTTVFFTVFLVGMILSFPKKQIRKQVGKGNPCLLVSRLLIYS